MLLRFSFSNHRCFWQQQEFSLVASSAIKGDDTQLMPGPSESVRVLPGAAIYGANASGKSTVLQALNYMQRVVIESQRSWAPGEGVEGRTPFRLVREAEAEPSEFHVDILVDGVRYEFGFSLNDNQILEEWLYAYPAGRRQTWYTRSFGAKTEFSFGKNLRGENRTIERLTRPNSLFLSAAAQNHHEQLLPVYRWFSEFLDFAHAENKPHRVEVTAQLLDTPDGAEMVTSLLQSADLGIVGAIHDKMSDPDEDSIGPRLAAAFEDMPSVSFRRLPGAKVRLKHRTVEDTIPIEFIRESVGTQQLFGLIGPIVKALDRGGLLAIDELDASLHPLLAANLVRLFFRIAPNTGAQLVFNTHDSALLKLAELRRDQVWFAEKELTGASHIYPLTDFRPRRAENLERGYLQGRYGAIPMLDEEFKLVGSPE